MSKLWEAATRGSKINDLECAAFCALRFNAFVEFAAICDSWAASEEAIITVLWLSEGLLKATKWHGSSFVASYKRETFIDFIERLFLILAIKLPQIPASELFA